MSFQLKQLLQLIKVLSLPKIEFAPLDLPLERRKQTVGAIVFATLLWSCFFGFIFLCTFPSLRPLILIYLVYIYFDKTADLGGRRSEWVRNLFIWKWLAAYFPTQIIVTTPLDPNENYIFGYHPHGIIGIGAFVNFATEATGVSQKLPGLNIRLLTIMANLYLPIYREILFLLNLASVSKPSIINILKKGPGHSALIVVGGAQESLSAKSTLCDLTLKNRMGFVKIALQAGAHLVPVFGFGENSLYEHIDVIPNSLLHKYQLFVKKWFGFTTPLFFGRGIFNYSFGLLPKRHPLNVVVGSPIKLERDPNPSLEKIQAAHQQYLDALKDLYETHYFQYSPSGSIPPPMRFI